MKIPRTLLLITSVLSLIAIFFAGCSKAKVADTTSTQTVSVERGNISVDISGVGNLALAKTSDLAFEIAGTVSDVLVEAGDTITKDQVLVKLDADDWQDQMSTLEDAVTQAQRTLTQKQTSVTQQELNVTDAQSALDDANEAWLKSTARGNKVMHLQDRLDWDLENDPTDTSKIEDIKEDLKYAWNDFYANETTSDDVTAKETSLTIAQADLEDAKSAVTDAQNDLEKAQKKLDDAKTKSAEIVAPFDGFVSAVNVEGGDEVLKGAVAVQVADPTQFETTIMVSEMDIYKILVGQIAQVQVDALDGMSFPARVLSISPTATVQSGVVNYQVKVELQPTTTPQATSTPSSTQTTTTTPQATSTPSSTQTTTSELPPQLQQAAQSGRITQEQAEEMAKDFQSSGRTWQGSPNSSASNISTDVQLKQGLTVSVNILVQQSQNVLMVPSATISAQNGKSYVAVVTGTGTSENREVECGITNYTYTEITSGLNEGDKVLMTSSAAAATTSGSSSSTRRGGAVFFGGGPPRD
jgi:HlyD family secretion protein